MAYENTPFVKIKDGVSAPKGLHYMPNGRLMSDADHIGIHGYIEKKLTGLSINTKDIDHKGETRSFTLRGDKGAIFSIEVYDDSTTPRHYNFDTKSFGTAKPNLRKIELDGPYTFSVKFPAVDSALIKYTIDIYAEIGENIKTIHVPQVEFRNPGGTININKSTGSNSNLLRKILHQDVAKNLYLSCVAPSLYQASTGTINVSSPSSSNRIVIDEDATSNKITAVGDKVTETGIADGIHALVTKIDPDNDDVNEFQISVADTVTNDATVTFTPPFNGMVPHYTDSTSGRNTTIISSGGSMKTSFSITINVLSGRAFSVRRNPTINDLCAITTVTIGSAASAISGEDTSSSSLFYRWPITNIAGLSTGMSLDPARRGGGTNTTVPAVISNYLTTQTLKSVTENKYSTTINDTVVPDVSIPGVDALNNDVTAVDRNGRVTAQAGNITFDVQQADALKSDSNVRIFAHGAAQIKSLTGMDISLSNVVATPTESTVTTSAAVVNSTTINLSDVTRASTGARVTGVGIDFSVRSGGPSVISKSAKSGAGSIVVSDAQTLDSGQTLTFSGTSHIITITGDITISNMALADTTLYFDVEKFLTAV